MKDRSQTTGARFAWSATDFLVQIGSLAGLALVLALAIYLLRRGGSSDQAPTG